MGVIHIDVSIAEECLQKKSFSHDKDGDAHYDVVSAFQKSIRGSDVNAALHYLGRLVEAGDLPSIARRLLVIAYEDIGLANPQAGHERLRQWKQLRRSDFPEARIPLANAIIELCFPLNRTLRSPPSTLPLVRYPERKKRRSPGLTLKDAHYQGAKKLAEVMEYKYPHSYESGWVSQTYLPDKLKNAQYYTPKAQGNSNRPSPRYMKISISTGNDRISPGQSAPGFFMHTLAFPLSPITRIYIS